MDESRVSACTYPLHQRSAEYALQVFADSRCPSGCPRTARRKLDCRPRGLDARVIEVVNDRLLHCPGGDTQADAQE